MFSQKIPPIISFGLGSVGYLCCFDSTDYINVLYSTLISGEGLSKDESKFKSDLEQITSSGITQVVTQVYTPYIRNRSRLMVEIDPEGIHDYITVNSNIFKNKTKDFKSGSFLNALNELTLETGWFTSKFEIEIYINGYYVSNLEAAGFIICTTTGSTAYNISAGKILTNFQNEHKFTSLIGGSIVQTEVEAISLTPILAENRSLGTVMMNVLLYIVFPSRYKITIKVPKTRQKRFFGCIDGDFRFEMSPGDTINIQGSDSSAPFVQTNETKWAFVD